MKKNSQTVMVTILTTMVAGLLLAEDGTWQWSDRGQTPRDAAEWSAPENWAGGVPSSAGDSATFTAPATATRRYITLPDELTLAKIIATDKNANVELIGKTITFAKGADGIVQLKDTANGPIFVYGTVTGTEGPGGYYTRFCGRLKVPSFTCSSGHSRLQLNYGAQASESVIENPAPETKLTYASGSLSVYLPRWIENDIQSSGWRTVEGSPYLYKNGAKASTTYTAGEPVEADGLPNGTFIRALFEYDSDTILLSKAATKSSDNVTVTFKAYTPKVRQTTDELVFSSTQTGPKINTYAGQTEDVISWTFGKVTGTAGSFSADSTERGRYVVCSAENFASPISIGNAHIEFQTNENGKAGFPKATAIYPAKVGDAMRFSVVEGVSAELSNLTNVSGVITKTGSGTLAASIDAASSSGFPCKVLAGRLMLSPVGSDKTIALSELDVETQATFEAAANGRYEVAAGVIAGTVDLPKGSVLVLSETVSLLPTAKIRGQGTCVLPPAETTYVDDFLVDPTTGEQILFSRSVAENQECDLTLDGVASFSAAEGKSIVLGTLSGCGSFVKTGGGEALICGTTGDSVSVVVEEGRVVLQSLVPTREMLPRQHFLHVDGSDGDTLEKTGDEIKKVSDCRNGSVFCVPVKDVKPIHSTIDALGGLGVIDFGSFELAASTWPTTRKGMKFVTGNGSTAAASTKLRTFISVYGFENGGGHLLGGNGSYNESPYGLLRGKADGESGTDVAGDAMMPLFSKKAMKPEGLRDGSNVLVRQNGTAIDPYMTGFSGRASKFDLITVLSKVDFEAGNFSQMHYGKSSGGQKIAEAVLYERELKLATVEAIESYLNKKWFNLDTPRYSQLKLDTLSLAPGTQVNVEGNAPVAVKTLSGAGVFAGSLGFSDNAVIRVIFDGVSAVGAISVTGEVDLSKGGTIEIVEQGVKAAVGDYTLVTSPSILASEIGEWIVRPDPDSKRVFKVIKQDGALKLSVGAHGLAIIVR